MDFGARIYDPRIGRFLSTDPKEGKNPFQTPYSVSNNSPIFGIDKNGEDFGYAMLYFLARQAKSAIAVSVGGSVGYGVGASAAMGMAVDKKGNFALYYSVFLPSADRNTVKVDKLSVGASATANLSILPGRQVADLAGSGFSVGGSAFSPLGLGGGGTVDFALDGKGKPSFLGVTISGGVGTPGASVGFSGASATWAALYSKGDYKTLFDTKWAEMGVVEAQEWTETVNNGKMGDPLGFWSYSGAREIYEPVAGEPGTFSVSIKQDYHFSTSGKGASKGMKDVSISKIIPTGIKMQQVDKTTLKSLNYKESDQ